VSDEELRIARTEALFRNVNERIAESAARFSADTTRFVCECSDQTCTDRVDATLVEYEEVRAEPTHFLLRPGHEDTRVERVVERRGRRHAVVQKFNELVARNVRRLDPRASQA
jgi:Tfp pilus assembly protein FimT